MSLGRIGLGETFSEEKVLPRTPFKKTLVRCCASPSVSPITRRTLLASGVALACAWVSGAAAADVFLRSEDTTTLSQPWRAVAAAIRSGSLGTVERIQVSGVMPDESRAKERCWDEGDGPALAAIGPHLTAISIICSLDAPRQVWAVGGNWRDDGRETPEALVMTAQYDRGLTVVLATGEPGSTPSVTVQGSRAVTEFELPRAGRSCLTSVIPSKAASSTDAAIAMAREAYRERI